MIPAEIRRELGISSGDVLLVRTEANRLVLEKREALLRRLRSRFRKATAGVSLADELIAERRAEGRREDEP